MRHASPDPTRRLLNSKHRKDRNGRGLSSRVVPENILADSVAFRSPRWQLRAILDKSSMTRLLGPGSSVFAAPHSGFAVWDKPVEDVKPGTIGTRNRWPVLPVQGDPC